MYNTLARMYDAQYLDIKQLAFPGKVKGKRD